MSHELNQSAFYWLSRLQKSSVLVVGDLGLDQYTYGTVDRISPEAPVPILKVTHQQLKLGCAANVAHNIWTLGGQAILTGVIGRDTGGDSFMRLLPESSNGIIQSDMVETIIKDRIVCGHQQLLRIDFEKMPVTTKDRNAVLDFVSRQSGKFMVIEDYGKGLCTQDFLQACISFGHQVLVDPHPSQSLESYRGCYLLTPNQKEAEALTGIKINNEQSLEDVGNQILDRTQAHALVITLGAKGMAIFFSGKKIHLNTQAREVYDVSGAGDTVIALMAMVLSQGGDVLDAAYLANVAAGIVVGKRGTATVLLPELEQALRNETNPLLGKFWT